MWKRAIEEARRVGPHCACSQAAIPNTETAGRFALRAIPVARLSGVQSNREIHIMTITMSAVYEDGVLKLEAPLKLQERAKVRVTIEESTLAATDDPTGWKAIDRLMGIGKAVAPDVSEKHDDHLYSDPRG